MEKKIVGAMTKVHILPPEVISKIAAGEIIERPASVVKELLENSLDAEAKTIEISVKQAGKTSIRIKDTGTGIEPDDIEKIFHRHSTSKIHNIHDLFAIRSMGFRGEALYSIAAVSDILLRSKTKSNDTGWEIHLRGGEKIDMRPVSMLEGTEIEIKELFFNTPARKKFLKSDTTELQQILNLVLPYTILYPEHRFSLVHNNKSMLDLPPEENHTNRIKKALNLEPKHIIARKESFLDKDISIELLLGDINIQRARKDMQFIYVNKRPVQNSFLRFHLNQVYRLIFPSSVHPFFSIHLTLPPENIDVNIHPTKREVKIKNESSLAPLLRALCEGTLLSHGKPKEMKDAFFHIEHGTKAESQKINDGGSCEQQIIFSQEKFSIPREQDNLRHKLLNASYIGSFLNKYLFFESGTSLLVIDQHAAQERITYEQLTQEIQSGHIEIQRLLTPFIMALSPQEMLAWENLKDVLEKMGFETTLWDNANIALHTHPQLIKKLETALRNILSGEDFKAFDMDTLARRACKNSLMAGDKMAQEEVRYLHNRLLKCHDPFICPHGRPTVMEIKDKTFEREFLRT